MRAKASRFIQANISTSPDSASWGDGGISPSFVPGEFIQPGGEAGATSQAHLDPRARISALASAHGVVAEVEDAGRQHGIRTAQGHAVGRW